MCGALRRIRPARARGAPEGRHVRKTLRRDPRPDPLCERGPGDEPHDVLHVPEVAVVRDAALLVEGEPGYYVEFEMKRGGNCK